MDADQPINGMKFNKTKARKNRIRNKDLLTFQ